MADKSIGQQYKEYANNIVGAWYNKEFEEIIIFSFLEKLTGAAKCVYISKERPMYETVYGLGIKATLSIIDEWYIDIGTGYSNPKDIYIIESLTPDLLILRKKNSKLLSFTKKRDVDFADEIIKGID